MTKLLQTACLSASLALQALGQPLPLSVLPPTPTNVSSVALSWSYNDTNAVVALIWTNGNVAASVPYPITNCVLSNLDANVDYGEYRIYASAMDQKGSNSLPSNVVYFLPLLPTNRIVQVWAVTSSNANGPWVLLKQWPTISVTNPTVNQFIKINVTNILY